MSTATARPLPPIDRKLLTNRVRRVGLQEVLVRELSHTYLGPRASATNGPLWLVECVRVADGHPVWYYTSEDPR